MLAPNLHLWFSVGDDGKQDEAMTKQVKFDVLGEKTMILDIEGRENAEKAFWIAAMSDDTIAMTYVLPPNPLHPVPVMETGKHWRKYHTGEIPYNVFAVDQEIARRRVA
jgi:hypothetical protein